MRLQDPVLNSILIQLIHEMLNRETFYKANVRGYVLTLFSQILRHYLEDRELTTPTQDKRIAMVKSAIRYMQEHFLPEPIGDIWGDYHHRKRRKSDR